MAIPTLDAMAERLEDLERDNRRMRLLTAVTLGALFLVVGGAVLLRAPARRTIEAEKLVIRDKTGRIRGTFGLAADGLPGLMLFDDRGNEQVVLNVPSDGNSSLAFADKGEPRLMLDASFDGSSRLRFWDKDEKSTSTLFMAPDSTAGLVMKNGGQGLTMGVQPDGHAAVFTTAKGGRESGRVGAPDVSDRGLGFGTGPAARPGDAVSADADPPRVPVAARRWPTKVSFRLNPRTPGVPLTN